MSGKPRVEEGAAKAPAYIVTFSTLITLLLAFFVVLNSMGSVRDETLLDIGYRGSFLESFKKGFGIRQKFVDFENFGYKFAVNEPDRSFDEGAERTIDAKRERLGRIIKKLRRSANISPSPMEAEKTDFSVTDIHFLPGEAVLDESGKQFLREFCLGFRRNPPPEAIKFYVLGLSSDQTSPSALRFDEASEKEQWIISARRAQAVADFMANTLPSWLNWPVYCWGAGAGGEWVAQRSPVYKQSQILIAVLRADK